MSPWAMVSPKGVVACLSHHRKSKNTTHHRKLQKYSTPPKIQKYSTPPKTTKI
jgi:hypothetical protein